MLPHSAPPGPPRTPPSSRQSGPAARAPASDSPLALKLAAGNPNKTWQIDRDERFFFYANEMRSKFVGPMDPQAFLEAYFGPDAFENNALPQSPWNATVKKAFTNVPIGPEMLMYPRLVGSSNTVTYLTSSPDSRPPGKRHPEMYQFHYVRVHFHS